MYTELIQDFGLRGTDPRSGLDTCYVYEIQTVGTFIVSSCRCHHGFLLFSNKQEIRSERRESENKLKHAHISLYCHQVADLRRVRVCVSMMN